MFIHILGSCSGTEPMPGRDYTSWVLEEDCGKLLWFDAGGACSSHAYCKGLSPLKIGAVFLSHPHLDHTGGLAGLFGTIRKEKWLRPESRFNKLLTYTATPEVVNAADALMRASSPGDEWDFRQEIHPVEPGEIFRDEEVVVDALPNAHMPPNSATGRAQSWSFRIRRKKTREVFVYTGDVKSLNELVVWLKNPIRLLMLETGHHQADELCHLIRCRAWPVKELLFLHHGLEILRDPVGEKEKADTRWGKPVLFASDGMTLWC